MDLLEKMATYVRVVEAGSFSAGAKQLRISPAAVSRQITTLEDERRLRVLREVDDAQAIGRTAATEGLLSVGAPVTSHLRLEVIGFDIQVNPARMRNFLNHDDQLIIAGSQLAVVEVIGWLTALPKARLQNRAASSRSSTLQSIRTLQKRQRCIVSPTV